MQHDIFISYSTVNSDWAAGVCQLLESNEYTVWMAPRDISPGATWGAEIVRGIQDCRLMLLLLSSASNHSRQVAREVELADSAQVPIIPVLLEAIKPEGDFLYFIGNTQWLTALGGTPQTHASTLLAAVRALSKSPSSPTPSPAPVDTSPPPPQIQAPVLRSVVAADSGAAAQRAPITPSQPISPPPVAIPASTTISKGPWLWVGLLAGVLVAALLLMFFRRTAPPPAPSPQPGTIAYHQANPWTGTYAGDVAKDRVLIHITEISSTGRHEFQITVDNANIGKHAESAVEIEFGQNGKLTFSLGEASAPRARCAVELTSDKQNLTGEWRQLKANHVFRVDFRRTSSEP
jgi:hypothetical protein